MICYDEELKDYVFHSFNLGDCEDPELYAAFPLSEFMDTDKGKWIREHCPDPQYRIRTDPQSWGYRCEVYGPLPHKSAFIYNLKYLGV